MNQPTEQEINSLVSWINNYTNVPVPDGFVIVLADFKLRHSQTEASTLSKLPPTVQIREIHDFIQKILDFIVVGDEMNIKATLNILIRSGFLHSPQISKFVLSSALKDLRDQGKEYMRDFITKFFITEG